MRGGGGVEILGRGRRTFLRKGGTPPRLSFPSQTCQRGSHPPFFLSKAFRVYRIPHGGFVIRTGSTGWNDENGHVIEYSLKLDSNPEFTASVIAAYARAAYRLSREGQSGCKTVFDIAPAYLSAADGAELRKHLL